MTWGEALENINLLAVALGTVSTLVWGAIWYAQRTLGTDWAKLVGLKKKDMENTDGMPVMMATSIIFYLIASIAIAALMQLTGMTGGGDGLLMGAILGFVFAFGPLAVTYGFARRKFELTLIDGGYMVVALATSGFVIGMLSS